MTTIKQEDYRDYRRDWTYWCSRNVGGVSRQQTCQCPNIDEQGQLTPLRFVRYYLRNRISQKNSKLGYLLAYSDSSSRIIPIVEKLPNGLHEKWIKRASRYKSNYEFAIPFFTEFSAFIVFIRKSKKIKNDPGFIFGP